MQSNAARKLKQLPERCLIVGVDPHKKHTVVVITQDFVVRDRFKFGNCRDGLEFLLRRAKTETVKSDCCGIMFAIETKGHYWRNVVYFFEEQDIPFHFISQYSLK